MPKNPDFRLNDKGMVFVGKDMFLGPHYVIARSLIEARYHCAQLAINPFVCAVSVQNAGFFRGRRSFTYEWIWDVRQDMNFADMQQALAECLGATDISFMHSALLY